MCSPDCLRERPGLIMVVALLTALISAAVAVAQQPAATNVTNHPARDEGPAWSPDGTKIAFETERADSPVWEFPPPTGQEASGGVIT